jgi:endonuclease/exonuclease/phosphatase family metal-dependent hydrolase
MAGNLTSGNLQAYDDGAGIRLFQIMAPDIALVQEMNFGARDDAATRSFVNMAFGPAYQFYRGPGDIPNGVVSKYPILASGTVADPEVANRSFVWARIDVPGPKDLWAFSLHLLTRSSTSRRAEGVALLETIEKTLAVPKGDYVVLGGDFNTDNRAEPVLDVLSARVVTSGPYPVDTANNGNTSANRSKPYDWVLVDPALSALEKPFELKSVKAAHGLILDTRVHTPLSELMPPLMGKESAASNMQHMPVARQFSLRCP